MRIISWLANKLSDNQLRDMDTRVDLFKHIIEKARLNTEDIVEINDLFVAECIGMNREDIILMLKSVPEKDFITPKAKHFNETGTETSQTVRLDKGGLFREYDRIRRDRAAIWFQSYASIATLLSFIFTVLALLVSIIGLSVMG